MYGVPDFYQNDNVKKGTGMQWRHQVVSDLPTECVCLHSECHLLLVVITFIVRTIKYLVTSK